MTQSQGQLADHIWWLLFRVMIFGQLGRSEEAKPVVAAALKLKPDVRERLWGMARIWNVPDPHIEHIADGLRKAGLSIELTTRRDLTPRQRGAAPPAAHCVKGTPAWRRAHPAPDDVESFSRKC